MQTIGNIKRPFFGFILTIILAETLHFSTAEFYFDAAQIQYFNIF